MKAIDIYNLRIRLRLSQEEFADLLGVHQTTVSKWELGGNISGSALKALQRLEHEDATRPRKHPPKHPQP
jgi:DNA-binding transcriptional regulator YiaG